MTKCFQLPTEMMCTDAEVFDGHTGCNDVARAAEIGIWSRQIAEHANAHGVFTMVTTLILILGGVLLAALAVIYFSMVRSRRPGR